MYTCTSFYIYLFYAHFKISLNKLINTQQYYNILCEDKGGCNCDNNNTTFLNILLRGHLEGITPGGQ